MNDVGHRHSSSAHNLSPVTRQGARTPLVSFGVPVRCAEAHLPRLLDSLLAQDMDDFEVVICDNDSEDGTPGICLDYARRDHRVRYLRNETNVGQVENFNRVLAESRGDYLRWIGADDWLEPEYARACCEVLSMRPEVVGVTTYQDFIEDDGTRHYLEYTGPRLDTADVAERFTRMLWFFTADYRFIDPIYTMMRRSHLLSTRWLQLVPRTDMVLSAELSLRGPFAHVPRCLAHRGKEAVARPVRLKRYHPTQHRSLGETRVLTRTVPAFARMVQDVEMSLPQRTRCMLPILRFAGRATYRTVYVDGRARLGRLRRRLGLVSSPERDALQRGS